MAEDEAIFDPLLRKKKKKKKTPFDLSALEDGSVPGIDGDMQAENGLENRDECEKENREEKDEDANLDLDDFSGLKKKKKKKKPFVTLDELETSLPETNEEVMMVMDDEREGDEAAGTDDDLDFNLPKKKKKKKKKINIDDLETEPVEDEDDGEPAFEGDEIKVPTSVSSVSWGGTDRDYTYDELLQRVFNIMREKNPDMVAGEKKRFVMRPPQVLRIGTKKTSFANFLEICKTLHRQPKHLQAFLLAELGTSGSVDANNQLIIKGRFQQKQIENVLRRYIKEYVTCHTCRSPETILQKDTRLFFLQCETCGSRCSVASIKSGFQAVTGKRAAIRAKTA
uniref:Eukaryotic translation initiation factor 2 subunit 2 n=1 Tax=Hadrurus spadix TaxID=141984 RepID=A0A1W7RAJ6_9SCOR